MENYMVSIGIGKGNCKVVRVDDNKLTCQPPKMEPGVNHSLTHKNGMPKIHVSCSKSNIQAYVHIYSLHNMESWIILCSCGQQIKQDCQGFDNDPALVYSLRYFST